MAFKADFGLDDLDDILGDLNDSLAGLDEFMVTDEDLQKHNLPKRTSVVIDMQDVKLEALSPDEMLKSLAAAVVEAPVAAPRAGRTAVTANTASTASTANAVSSTKSASPPPAQAAVVDDIMAQLSMATQAVESIDPNEQQKIKERRIAEAMERLKQANIKKLNLKVGVNGGSKTVPITSLMSTEQIISDTLEKARLDPHPEWTLFEVVTDFGIERPIKHYEKVTDIVYSWEIETTNTIVLRQFPGKRALNTVKTTQEFPRMSGVMYLEKKGKWTKRYFELKFSGMYHYKDTKLSQETFFCAWNSVDVYDVLVPRKKAPSKYCFALKSQERMSKSDVDDPSDYCRFLCVEDEAVLEQWTSALRNAKNRKFLEDHPEYLGDPSLLNVSAEKEVLNRLREGYKKTEKVEKKEGLAAAMDIEKQRKEELDMLLRKAAEMKSEQQQQPAAAPPPEFAPPVVTQRRASLIPPPDVSLPTPVIPPPDTPPPAHQRQSMAGPASLPPPLTAPPPLASQRQSVGAPNLPPPILPSSLPPANRPVSAVPAHLPPPNLPGTLPPVPAMSPPLDLVPAPLARKPSIPGIPPPTTQTPPVPLARKPSNPGVPPSDLPSRPPPVELLPAPLARAPSNPTMPAMPLMPTTAPPPVAARRKSISQDDEPAAPANAPPVSAKKPLGGVAMPGFAPVPGAAPRPMPSQSAELASIVSGTATPPVPPSSSKPATTTPLPPTIALKPKTPPPIAGFGQVSLGNLPPPPAAVPPPAQLPPPPVVPVAHKPVAVPAPTVPPSTTKPPAGNSELEERMKKIAAKNYVA